MDLLRNLNLLGNPIQVLDYFIQKWLLNTCLIVHYSRNPLQGFTFSFFLSSSPCLLFTLASSLVTIHILFLNFFQGMPDYRLSLLFRIQSLTELDRSKVLTEEKVTSSFENKSTVSIFQWPRNIWVQHIIGYMYLHSFSWDLLRSAEHFKEKVFLTSEPP